MTIGFKDYRQQQKESFFETEYPSSVEDDSTEIRVDDEVSSPETDSAEQQ